MKQEEMTKISFRLPAEEKTALEEFAKANDLTVSQIIRKACRNYLFMCQAVEEANKLPN